MNKLLTFEDKLDYLIEMVESDERRDWDKAVDDLCLSCHPDTIRKAWNVGDFSGYQVAKYYENKSCENISTEQIDRLEKLKDAEYKERCRLQDANREKRAWLREEARFENLLDVLKDCVDKYSDVANDYYYEINEDLQPCEASILISDIHAGLKVENALNYYSIETLKEYFISLFEKTVKYCKLHNVNKLNIELLGDLISGSIQISNKADHEEDVISQIILVSELLSDFIFNIKKCVQEVVVYGVIGNHSRIEADKRKSVNRENFERLIFEYIKIRVPEVNLIQNGFEDYLSYKTRNGKLIALSHGDKDSIQNAKSHFTNVLKENICEAHLGHIHHFEAKDDSGTLVITNGSFISTDNYAVGLRCNTEPYQILRIYGDDDIIYKLTLK